MTEQLITAIVAYLLGSIPFGLILTRLAGLGDIRAIGSGNIGATNVLRTGNKGLAAATLLLDGGKGALAVALAHRFAPELAPLAALFAVLGHLFPVWLGFKGGKGVASALGVWLVLAWPVGMAACAAWVALAFLSRRSSTSSLLSIGGAPVLAWFVATPAIAGVGAVIAVLVAIRHRENIQRLLAGTEPRIGQGK